MRDGIFGKVTKFGDHASIIEPAVCEKYQRGRFASPLPQTGIGLKVCKAIQLQDSLACHAAAVYLYLVHILRAHTGSTPQHQRGPWWGSQCMVHVFGCREGSGVAQMVEGGDGGCGSPAASPG